MPSALVALIMSIEKSIHRFVRFFARKEVVVCRVFYLSKYTRDADKLLKTKIT